MNDPKQTVDIEQIARAVAEERIRHALTLIEQAQNNLSKACELLCPITGQGARPLWLATSKLHDRVKADWYRVESFLQRRQFGLDELNTAAIARERRSPEISK